MHASNIHLYIVSAASQNHYRSLKQFLGTVDTTLHTCYVYDLGLNQESVDELTRDFNVIFRKFNYAAYPPYFNIHIDRGVFAWKPAIIKEVMDDIDLDAYPHSILLWCDSGNFIEDKTLIDLKELVVKSRIHSTESDGNLDRWTQPGTFQHMGISPEDPMHGEQMRNAAIIALYITDVEVRKFVQEFNRLAHIKDCIAPPGWTYNNHRWDQSILSILYYKFFRENPHYGRAAYNYTIQIHRDIN